MMMMGMVFRYCQATHNTVLYQRLHRKLADCVGGTANGQAGTVPDVAVGAADQGMGERSFPALDLNWVDTRNKKAQMKLEKLDNDLKNYKSNSIKESIRRGHDDLGDHFLDRYSFNYRSFIFYLDFLCDRSGDLANALKCYSRARDYCTSGKHVVSMCVNVIKVSVYLQNWSHVISYVNKALATPDLNDGNLKSSDHLTLVTRLKCAGGLADLMTRKYSAAAKQFLAASLDHCECPDLLSPNNVAIYGGLTALATFDRAELYKQVISSAQFKLFLELEPQLREVIQCFYDSRFYFTQKN